VAASVGAASPDAVGSSDLSALQRAADAALYDGKHSGHAVLPTAVHTTVPSVNGRRTGRPARRRGVGGTLAVLHPGQRRVRARAHADSDNL
jgi:hypothetical protein